MCLKKNLFSFLIGIFISLMFSFYFDFLSLLKLYLIFFYYLTRCFQFICFYRLYLLYCILSRVHVNILEYKFFTSLISRLVLNNRHTPQQHGDVNVTTTSTMMNLGVIYIYIYHFTFWSICKRVRQPQGDPIAARTVWRGILLPNSTTY